MSTSVALVAWFALFAVPGAAVGPDSWPALVDGAWLQDRLADGGVAVVDARPSLRDYLGGHVPGAQYLAVENLRSSSSGIPAESYPSSVFREITARLGLDRRARVVVYGQENDPDASFVAAALRRNGIERVALLDGGFARWTAENRPTTKERPPVARGHGTRGADAGAVASYDDVRIALGDGRTLLLDARSPDQYEAGHVPGAVSRFWKADLVGEGDPRAGLFKDDATLRREYEALGVRPDVPVIVYCNTGHMASVVFHTLRYRLGLGGVRLYDGSWLDWSARTDAPVEKGAARIGARAAP